MVESGVRDHGRIDSEKEDVDDEISGREVGLRIVLVTFRVQDTTAVDDATNVEKFAEAVVCPV